MLQSIIQLTLSPRTLDELGYPALVDGCIKLMKLVSSDQVVVCVSVYRLAQLSVTSYPFSLLDTNMASSASVSWQLHPISAAFSKLGSLKMP